MQIFESSDIIKCYNTSYVALYLRIIFSSVAVSWLLATRSIQRPCPPACSAWMFLWWTMQTVRGPILAWSPAGWCAPDTWMEAETRAMWIILFLFVPFNSFVYSCSFLLWQCFRWNTAGQFTNEPSSVWSGWLWQPLGVLGRGARPGVMGSRVCTAGLPWGLCQGVRVPLLDRRRSQSQPLKKFPIFLFTVDLTLPPPVSSKTTCSLFSHRCHRQTHKPECRQENKHLLVHPLSFYLSFQFFV